MKICHIITRCIIGGAQENTLLTCEGLRDLGHDVVLMAGPETGPEGSLWDRVETAGLASVKIQTMRRAVRPLLDWRCLRELEAELRQGRFDVVHTHSSKAGILGRLAAHRAGTPLVVHTIHGMSFNRTQPAPLRVFYRALERWAGRYTHAFVSVADAMTDQAVAAGLAERERFTTIHSGMETDRFTPDQAVRQRVRADWGVAPDDVVVGTIARLFRNKGYEEILAAMPHMVRAAAASETPGAAATSDMPGAAAASDMAGAAGSLRFVWVGDGRDRPRYEQELSRIGLRDRVHLTGLVRPEQIPALLAGFDILVHASRWEGLPRAVPQALLMEVPVVTFDNDGAPEVVQPGQTGVLVPFGDIPTLAQRVADLAQNPAERHRLAHQGRQRCLEMFDHHKMTQQIDELYHRLLG